MLPWLLEQSKVPSATWQWPLGVTATKTQQEIRTEILTEISPDSLELTKDPKEIQQKTIPLDVISLIAKEEMTEIQQATSQLIIGTFFFACCSCKYLKVQ